MPRQSGGPMQDPAREHAQDSTPRPHKATTLQGGDPRVTTLLALQRSAGNRAVGRALRDPQSPSGRVLQRMNPFKAAYKWIRKTLGGGQAAPAVPAAAPAAPAPLVTPYPGTNIVIRDNGAYQN